MGIPKSPPPPWGPPNPPPLPPHPIAQWGGVRPYRDPQVVPPTPSPPRPIAHCSSSSLMSSMRFMLGNFSCRSFLRPLLSPTGTTLTLLQGGGERGQKWG